MIEVKVPSPGESISQVQLATWLVGDGDYVEKDDEIAEIDSDKATLSISAEESGKISIKVEEGETVEVGATIAEIDTDAKGKPKKEAPVEEKAEPKKTVEKPKQEKEETTAPADEKDIQVHVSPLARKLMSEKNISEKDILDQYKSVRISKKDVLDYKPSSEKAVTQSSGWEGNREEERKKLSTLRMKVAERLVSVKNETAMLTTFNEVNMSAIMAIRKKYNPDFVEKYGFKVGFMSFFTKAVTEAIQFFPKINSMMDGDEMVLHKYVDVGIAVSAPKGLVVPVIRNAEMKTIPEIEKEIAELADKARKNKITLEEMTGGTFTITNGGVFGSMLSTPIINPPQSAILGMHNIVERPIAVNGKVEIHPMMYVAVSYDHRIVDGRESVGFLVKVKELLENPSLMLTGGEDPNKILLGL